MSQTWLFPVNYSQSIVRHYMNTKEKTATTWNIKKLPSCPCPSCYEPQKSKCVQCSGSTWGRGRVQWWEEGSRGIITIYCNHRGHRNPCMSLVSEGLHILYGHTTLIRHRSESTSSHTGGRLQRLAQWIPLVIWEIKNTVHPPIQRQSLLAVICRGISGMAVNGNTAQ